MAKKLKASRKTKGSRESKGIKKTGLVILSIMLLIFVLSFIGIRIIGSNVLVHARMNTTIRIGDYVGINLDRDKLHFGTTSTSGFSEREFIFWEPYSGFIYMTANEPMADWIYLPDTDDMKIAPFQNRSIITYAVPRGQNAVPGEYESTIDIWVLREKPDWLTKMLLGGTEIQAINVSEIKFPKVSITIVPRNQTNSTETSNATKFR